MKHARENNRKSSSEKRTSLPRERSTTKRVPPDNYERINDIEARHKASSLQKKQKKKKNKFVARLRGMVAILLCIVIVVGLGVGAGMYAAVSSEINDMDFDSIAYNFSSVIYADDEDGNSQVVASLHSDGNREWLDSDKIPDIAKDATISIEDERFLKHNGVDLKRTFGATFWYAVSKITHKSPSYGGSTITQQVIKNITNEKDKTAMRKIKEMMRAVALEKRFTKDEILTTYLNIVYFGNQCYGIEAASKVYFSKKASELTLPEAAMIVGITQAPSKFNPFKNPDEAKRKRNLVLKKMYELGKITEEEYTKASESKLGVNTKYKAIHASVYNYFVDQVILDVVSALQTEKGYSKEFAEQQVLGGGYKIYTTMDPNIQEAIDSVYREKGNFPAASSGTQSAMVVLDPYTGEIKGMAGGIGQKTESRGLNRATQSARQPGSSIKPLSVYSTALETGKINAASIVKDQKLDPKIDLWAPKNWDPKNSYTGYKGDMSVRKAIEISANIPAIRTLQSVGLETSYNFLTKKYHMSTIVPDDKNISPLSLGGLTKGVTVKDMAAAYGVFANKGIYVTPHTYTKVLDSSGKVLLEFSPKSNRVLSEGNAFIMTSFLSEVVNGSSGTGRRARLSNMPTYGKTGTTNSNHDKWFVGFTPYYVGAVWYGYDNKPIGVSTNASVTIWNKVMSKVHANLPKKDFEVPHNVESAQICQRTGKLSSKGCKYAKTEYFIKGTIPSKYCNNASGNYNDKTSEINSAEGAESSTTTSDDDFYSNNETENETPTTKPESSSDSGTSSQQKPAQDNSSSSNVITLD